MQRILGPVLTVLLWGAPAMGHCQSKDLPAAPTAPVPAASLPNAPAGAGKSPFELPASAYDRPTGAAPNPKKGWFCEAPLEGVFAEKGNDVPEAMKGQVNSYMRLVYTQIMDTWVSHLPRDAKKNAWAKGRVAKVRFVIMDDGSHTSPEVTLSSGRSDYDGAALDAIRERDTFPSMPEGYKGPLRMCMTFVTNEERPDGSQDWMKKVKK